MRFFTARRLAFAALVPTLLVLSVIPGCSNQSEGERCGDDNNVANNDDCESGLVCTLIKSASTNRCCYADGHATDSRCVTGSSPSATSQGGGSGVGDAGASNVAEAGASSAAGGTSGAGTEAGAAGMPAEVAGAGG